MLTFASYTLFAQSKKDTVLIGNTPKTETATKRDTSINALLIFNPNSIFKISLKENSNWKYDAKKETVYAILQKNENGER